MSFYKQDNAPSSTNTSNNASTVERNTVKYRSTKEMISLSLPVSVRSKTRSSQTLTQINSKLRRDIYGSLILKGSRKHRVSFRDNIIPIKDESENEIEPIAEIVNVPSFKEYTAQMSYNESDKIHSQEVVCCESGCIII